MTQTTYLTPGEVMARLKVDRQTLYAFRQDGTLPFVQLSTRRFRYPSEAVDALLAVRSAGAAPDPTGRARVGRKSA